MSKYRGYISHIWKSTLRLLVLTTAVWLFYNVSLFSAGAASARESSTVVFELSNPVDDPKNFNWFFANVRRDQGAHQAMFEPLFLFNYKPGALDLWLAKSITPNAAQDVWPLKLRADVKWSDSQPGYEGEAQG
jgi:peptide/nickel transport system substrate-binding protein